MDEGEEQAQQVPPGQELCPGSSEQSVPAFPLFQQMAMQSKHLLSPGEALPPSCPGVPRAGWEPQQVNLHQVGDLFNLTKTPE